MAKQKPVSSPSFNLCTKLLTKATDANHLKGLQTAGGNKVVMSDKKGAQTILLSNSNNKGTAVEVGFKGDGSITIKSNGPISAKNEVVVTSQEQSVAIKAKVAGIN